MRAGNQAGSGMRLALYIVAALAAVVVLGTSLGLVGYIDQKLKQGAEQQVVTFTQQAAGNVTDRIFIVQNAIGAFEVQSADPAAVVPALEELARPVRLWRLRSSAWTATGSCPTARRSPSTIWPSPKRPSRKARTRIRPRSTLDGRPRVRLAQRPLYLDGAAVGALYVQIPLNMFSMERSWTCSTDAATSCCSKGRRGRYSCLLPRTRKRR
ncbi:MAG: hypothetical protein V8S24_13915 [Gordonibacter pamelaeae]